MDYEIVNRPVPVPLSDYEEEITRYVADVSVVKGVVSIYTMGSVGAPGLSDIDIIVVVEDDFDSSCSRLLATRDRNDQLYIHGPIVIPECLAESLQYIIYASGLVLRYGHDVLGPFEDLEGAEQKALKLAYLIDFLESRQVQHAAVELSNIIDMRSWVARLWSLTHSEKLLLDSGMVLNDKESTILAGIRKIRKRWLENETVNDVAFIKSYHGAISLSRSVWEKVIQYCYKDAFVSDGNVKGYVGNKFLNLSPSFSSCEAKVQLLRIPKASTLLYMCKVNARYLLHLNNYGYLFPVGGQNVAKTQNLLMEKRSKLVRAHWAWLKKHCPDADSMAGYLGLGGGSMSNRSTFITSIYAKFLGYREIGVPFSR